MLCTSDAKNTLRRPCSSRPASLTPCLRRWEGTLSQLVISLPTLYKRPCTEPPPPPHATPSHDVQRARRHIHVLHLRPHRHLPLLAGMDSEAGQLSQPVLSPRRQPLRILVHPQLSDPLDRLAHPLRHLPQHSSPPLLLAHRGHLYPHASHRRPRKCRTLRPPPPRKAPLLGPSC